MCLEIIKFGVVNFGVELNMLISQHDSDTESRTKTKTLRPDHFAQILGSEVVE